MFRKHKLRKEYDQKLIDLMGNIKTEWDQKNAMLKLSYEPDDELKYQMQVARAKYLFLFKEAKIRKISIKGQ